AGAEVRPEAPARRGARRRAAVRRAAGPAVGAAGGRVRVRARRSGCRATGGAQPLMGADDPVVVVGAGLAGLACATTLHRAGRPVRVLEAADGVGGRVRTDIVDGFRLDRGFQVLLTAYPEAHRQ